VTGEVVPVAAGPGPKSPDESTAAGPVGRAWLAALPDELAAQRRVMAILADRCEAWPLATSLWVGCSLGRGAADALSDIDAALGVDAPPGADGAGRIGTAEAMVVAALPELGALVDVLRHRTGPDSQHVRRIFAQFADRTQLDLAVVAEAEIKTRRRAGGAPDFIPLYQARPAAGEPDDRMPAGGGASGSEPPAAYAVTGEQVREWAFHGWCALIDADKYLRRGSLWEAHGRLHEARHYTWVLWRRRRAPCTRGTACRRCSTTTPRTCRRTSGPPWPASTRPDCTGPPAPARRCSPPPARPPPAGTRPTSRPRWPPTSPASSPANPDRGQPADLAR
jgi:hypothetical protein